MNTIKNMHLFDSIALSHATRDKLDADAAIHKLESNITYKILEVGDKTLTVRVKQEKNAADNYLDKKTLVSRTRELFGKFLPGWKIHPQVIPFSPNPVSDVDAQWIKKQMDKYDVRVIDLVADTGVDKTNISAWANATRPMSQPVKAMFYYYFKFRSR